MRLENVNNSIMSQHHSTQEGKYLQPGLLEHMFSYKKTVYKKNRWFDGEVKEALDAKLEQSSATHNAVFPIHTAIEIHTIPRGYISENLYCPSN